MGAIVIFPKVVPMGAIVIRTRYDEGTESAEVATSARGVSHCIVLKIEIHLWSTCLTNYCQDSHGLLSNKKIKYNNIFFFLKNIYNVKPLLCNNH